MSWGPTKEVQTLFEATGASKNRIAVSKDPTGPRQDAMEERKGWLASGLLLGCTKTPSAQQLSPSHAGLLVIL